MFWLGSGVDSYRKVIREIENRGYLQPITQISFEPYLEKLINSKIGLSYYMELDKYNTPYDHPGEFCYRDIEYMALGIPMIRFNYLSELNPNLIPNYHYISINRPDDLIIDRLGNESHAKLIEERFLEVKDDYEFLNFISKNARQYYTDYLSRENRVNHTIKLLNL